MLQEQQVPSIPGDTCSCGAGKVLANCVVFRVEASNRVCQRAPATHPARHQVQEVYLYAVRLVLLLRQWVTGDPDHLKSIHHVHSTNQFSIEGSHNGSCVQQDVSISNLLNGPLLITN
jgi:hypothetical protein